MKILIGADVVPTQTNATLFSCGDGETLVGRELLDILQSADYRIFNLEVPLTDTETPIPKVGPALIAGTDTVAGYKALRADLLTLANNHIMDQGKQGLVSTIKVLEENGIAHVGAGESLQAALQPHIVESGGQKIGIYACAEHEFSIADETVPGANPYDPLESFDHVAALKSQCDYVIVLYHGGKEHYRYPSAWLQKTCRKFVEKGADLVVCQHTHCVGCEEKYKDGTIVYGQGNFLFDHSQSEYWKTSLLLEFQEGKVTYIPLVKTENTVRLAKDATAESILDGFAKRSEEIQDPVILNQKYQAFADGMRVQYLSVLSGMNNRGLVLRIIERLTGGRLKRWFLKRKYSKEKLLTLRNLIECEAHREVLLRGITEKDLL